MTGRPAQRLRRGAAAISAALGAIVLVAPPVYAQPPNRVGWWNSASAGGVAAPAPTTPGGGIHVAAAPGQVLAYGAVLYPLPAGAVTGRLTLAITGSQGTVRVQACPTTTTQWAAGGDQPAATAPAYDCSADRTTGTVSSDGHSVTFSLVFTDATKPLSLAIVPDLSAATPAAVNEPFSLDIGKPGAGSLTTTSTPVATGSAAPPPAAPPAPGPAAAAVPPVGHPLGVPTVSSAQTLPAPSTGTAVAPQLAPGTTPAANAARPPTTVTGRSAAATAGTAGTVIGGLALVVAFLFWGAGRGLLGGRIPPLSLPIAGVTTPPGPR